MPATRPSVKMIALSQEGSPPLKPRGLWTSAEITSRYSHPVFQGLGFSQPAPWPWQNKAEHWVITQILQSPTALLDRQPVAYLCLCYHYRK